MKKEIVEEICKKYGKSERIINSMIKNTLKEGYTFKETVNLIEKFYIEKSMQ